VSPSQRIAVFFATAGGVGYSPIAPGTLGTLVAVPISLAFNQLVRPIPRSGALLLIGLTVMAILLADRAATALQQKDPQIVVIDEVVGFMVANFLAPADILSLIVSFALFRFFDIVKVYPAAKLENLPGGRGIVLDDVMAGLYTLAIMQALRHLEWL
jgi:phosphatidylglycerophosphatase A